MKNVVTMKELFAIIIRYGKRLLVLAVVFALLMGAYRGGSLIKINSQADRLAEDQEQYALDLEQYNTEKGALEDQLEKTSQSLESQLTYQENSILMKITPQEKYTTTMVLAISGVGAISQDNILVTDAMLTQRISAIQSRYQSLWAVTNLESLTAETSYAEVEDKYLQEVILLTIAEGGVLQISVVGPDGAVTKQVADKIYGYLTDSIKTVSAGTYAHTLTLIGATTKSTMDQKLLEQQQLVAKSILEYTGQIETLTLELEQLTEPHMPAQISAVEIAVSAVKYAILGGVVGAVLACVWVILQYLFRNRVETSYQMEQGLKVPFLGSLSVPRGFRKLSCKIMGERFWENTQQARAYILAGLEVRAPQSRKVLIASTLETAGELQLLAESLSAQGYQLTLVGNAQRNPQLLTAAKECEVAVLAETAGVSGVDNVCDVAETLTGLNVPICGFIMY